MFSGKIKLGWLFTRVISIAVIFIQPVWADESNKSNPMPSEEEPSEAYIGIYDTDPIRYIGKPAYLSGRLSTFTEKEAIAKGAPYSLIIKALQIQLKTNWWNSLSKQYESQADYHVIFIAIQDVYSKEWGGRKIDLPDVNPTLPADKYADAISKHSLETYRFTSPWMRGVLYIKEGKPVGGKIIFPTSELSYLNELYHMAHNEWDDVTSRDSTILDEMSMPDYMYKSTIEQYHRIAFSEDMVIEPRKIPDSEYKMLTQEQKYAVLRASWSKLKEKRLEKINEVFTTKGKAVLSLARILVDIYDAENDRPSKYNIDKCLKKSEVFYIRLYEHLCDQLFAKTSYKKNDNIVHNITPSVEVLQLLHKAAGDYNCFSPDFKEFSK